MVAKNQKAHMTNHTMQTIESMQRAVDHRGTPTGSGQAHLRAYEIEDVRSMGTVGDIVITETETLRLAEVYSFFSRYAGWPETADIADQLYSGQGYAARSGTEILGIVIFTLLPSLVTGETLCFLFGTVDPAHRRRRLGTRLMKETISAVRKVAPRLVVIAFLPEKDEQSTVAFLRFLGFAEMDTMLRYERDLTQVTCAVEQLTYNIREYKGGEQRVDESIIDLYRRAYRGHLGIPDLTFEWLRKQLAQPSCSYILLRHNGQLVGHASMWINQGECYVDSALVARSHWGSGASDAIARSLLRIAVERGCTTISGMAASTNRPSRSLMERYGLQVGKSIKRFLQTYVD